MAGSNHCDINVKLLPSCSSDHQPALKSDWELKMSVSNIHIQTERLFSPRDICIRPCYYLLQVFGMWQPYVHNNPIKKTMYQIYQVLVLFVWLTSLVAVLSADFIRYGFKRKRVHFADVMNSVTTCINLLCPFVFAKIYLNRGQFKELVLDVQNLSAQYQAQLRKRARIYTWVSITFWLINMTYFTFQWKPFITTIWHFVVYIPVIIYGSGWWAVWLSIYAYICDVHSLQIDALVDHIRSKESSSVQVLYKQQQVRNSIDRTQQDFNIIISFAVSYHALDIIMFSFAYFDNAFGKHYEIWQYAVGVFMDLASILIKLSSPALLAAAVHRSVIEAAKRCDVTSPMERMPEEDIRLFQYMVSCERDMGLKILGIRITVELVGTILMTIVTAVVSFVAFVVPRLT